MSGEQFSDDFIPLTSHDKQWFLWVSVGLLGIWGMFIYSIWRMFH